MSITSKGIRFDHQRDSGHSSLLDVLVKLYSILIESARRCILAIQLFMRETQFQDALNELITFLSQHPLLAVIVIIIFISLGIPILMFILFAFATALVTFTGFLVIEGTILTIASMLLCGFLLTVLLVIATLSAALTLSYFGFLEVYGLINSNSKLNFILQKLNGTTTSRLHDNNED